MIPRPVRSGILPFEYVDGFLRALKSSPRIQFRTHADLPFDPDFRVRSEADMKEFYRKELDTWRNQRAESGDIEVFLLHDCDSGPRETVYLCNHETELGVVSTTSLFVEVPDPKGGTIPYDIDYQHLVALQQHGQCFTYHCNGPQLCGYDDDRVPGRINADVEALVAMGFDIRFFSPHGARASPEGKSNTTYFYPQLFRRPLVWTHNRFAPSGHRYSDGGLVGRLKRGDPTTDLRAYMLNLASLPSPAATQSSWRTWLKSVGGTAATKLNSTRRVFILLHPQYYFAETLKPDVMASDQTVGWLREYWHLHERGRADEYWAPLVEALHQPAG